MEIKEFLFDCNTLKIWVYQKLEKKDWKYMLSVGHPDNDIKM